MNAIAAAHASSHAAFLRSALPDRATGAPTLSTSTRPSRTALSSQAAEGASLAAQGRSPGVSGGGPLGRLLHIDLKNVLLYGTVGAIAAMVIPPLAPLGAIGGALLGAAVSILF